MQHRCGKISPLWGISSRAVQAQSIFTHDAFVGDLLSDWRSAAQTRCARSAPQGHYILTRQQFDSRRWTR